jgi:malonate transporter and related proteins
MSLLPVIVDALVPIAFVILLGLFAGRAGIVKPESSGVLATLALDFCLPSLLFAATATMTTAELQNWRFFLGIALGLLSIYVLALAISLAVFRKPITPSSLQALNSAFPNMAFIGVPVLTAVIGASAVLSVVVGNLISSFVLLPLTLTFLEAGSPAQQGHNGSSVVWSSMLGALKKPLVWAPLAGIVMAAAHIPLPSVAQKSFSLIGDATSGVALFTLGLLLSQQKLRVGAAVALNVVLKNLAQPAAMWLLAVLLGVTGLQRREMILLGALPTASMTAMFAVQYNVYAEESDATILLSTVLSIATLGATIALTR